MLLIGFFVCYRRHLNRSTLFNGKSNWVSALRYEVTMSYPYIMNSNSMSVCLYICNLLNVNAFYLQVFSFVIWLCDFGPFSCHVHLLSYAPLTEILQLHEKWYFRDETMIDEGIWIIVQPWITRILTLEFW